ncbi:MAG: SnoaL-like domain-containing protein [Marinicaulis sp.]|nr:SnoaL-like domain-containing protein [Marinicaulis sp.]
MENLIEPNIYPVLVHFAYALTVTGALSLFVVSLTPSGGWRDTLKHAGDWMLGFGALFIIATAAAGFQAYYSVDHDGPSHAAMTVHRNWAVPTAAAILALAVWRWAKRAERPSILFSIPMLAAAASLSVTAWWGGKLVYGHGLGVSRMPVVTGEGHDHEHAPGQGHGDDGSAEPTSDHEDGHDHDDAGDLAAGETHDHGDNAAAEPETSDTASAAAFDADNYPATPEAVVDAYGAALRAKDATALRALLAPDVIVAEGGGAERSVEEYAGHHMPADMAFTAAVDFSLKKRDLIENGDLATVVSESQIHGTYKGENVHSRMMETMVLRRDDGRWRIVHIHWSSAPITGEHEH